jgi:hypothetical protein
MQRVCHFFAARHRRGFGIHSPFVFQLLENIFFEKYLYYGYQIAEKADIHTFKTAKNTCSIKYKRLIFRLANSVRAQKIVLAGASSQDFLYHLAALNAETEIVVYSANEESFGVYGETSPVFRRITHSKEAIEMSSSVDMAVFDMASCNAELLEACLCEAKDTSIFVFLNLYLTTQTVALWQQFCAWRKVRLSIDIFQMGIVWFRPELPEQNYKIAF